MSDKPFIAIRTVTIFGVGKMGCPMPIRLLVGGSPFACHGKAAAMLDPRLKTDVTGAVTLQDAVCGADAVITMLTDCKAVRAVMLGPSGAERMTKKGSLPIDMSSWAPMGTCNLDEDMLKLGIEIIDEPLSSGRAKAVFGSSVSMAVGFPDQVKRVWPLPDSLGNKVFNAGSMGSGHAIKAFNTFGFALTSTSKDFQAPSDLALQLGSLSRCGLPALSGLATLWAEELDDRGNHADVIKITEFLKVGAERHPQRGGSAANHDCHLRLVE